MSDEALLLCLSLGSAFHMVLPSAGLSLPCRADSGSCTWRRISHRLYICRERERQVLCDGVDT